MRWFTFKVAAVVSATIVCTYVGMKFGTWMAIRPAPAKPITVESLAKEVGEHRKIVRRTRGEIMLVTEQLRSVEEEIIRLEQHIACQDNPTECNLNALKDIAGAIEVELSILRRRLRAENIELQRAIDALIGARTT